MSEGSGLWDEGQQVWKRLSRWYRGAGDEALQALTDVRSLRLVLDQAEFEAIRASRRQGKSWAEIATRLGITRQSAWERWQDVDQPEPLQEETRMMLSAAQRRRQATVVVPNVTGMRWEQARRALMRARLVATGPDQDGPSFAADWPDAVVTDQSPESGAMAVPGTAVRLWIDREGGSGVREPRRPKPDPHTGRKMRDELTDETIG